MVVFLFVVLLTLRVSSYDNGVGRLPAMGWNTWYQFKCNINETLVLETADGIIKHGLDKVGYKYVNLDDCWQLVDRDEKGNIVADPKTFPSGIKSLSDKIRSKGLKFGLYTDIGTKTCAGTTYMLYQGFTTPEIRDKPWEFYQNFSNYLNQTNRHMLFSICNWGVRDPATWAPKMSNSWRTTGDIGSTKPFYKSVLDVTDINEKLTEYAGLYNYNDPDFLLIGVVDSGALNIPESRAQFSLWAIMAAPLILSLDLRGDVDKNLLEIIKNTEVIAINQDNLGKQGYRVAENKQHIVDDKCVGAHCTWTQTYYRELDEGKIAVLLLNHASKTESSSKVFSEEKITVKWEEIKLDPTKKMKLRDPWSHKDLGTFTGQYQSGDVDQHDVQLLVMTPELP